MSYNKSRSKISFLAKGPAFLGVALSSLLTSCMISGQDSGTMSLASLESSDEYSGSGRSVCINNSIGLIGLEGSALHLSGNSSVDGDVILLEHSRLSVSGNASIKGKIYSDAGDSDSRSVKRPEADENKVEDRDLSEEKDLLNDFESTLTHLSTTQELDSVQGSAFITGKGGLNVIDIRGGLRLSGQDQLVLAGSEKDIFVIRVADQVQVSGKATISVMGGARSENVIFVNAGSGSQMQLSGQGEIHGTFFAPDRGVLISGGGTLSGAVVAGGEIQISGNGVTFHPAAFCVEAPSPAPSPSPTSTASPDPSASPSPTGTASPDPLASPSPTGTASPDPLASPSPTVSPSPTPTPCTGLVCSGGLIGV